VESAPKAGGVESEAEKKTQMKYRVATRYALQEGELGDCFTCGY